MDLEWGWCPVDHQPLMRQEIRTENLTTIHYVCACGYARLVTAVDEKPWRR